jgi:hypothetical protein
MSIVLSPAVGINTLHCGSCWLFQNVWELTQTHCIVDDTVGIDCFHCEQHCSALGAFLSCVFFFYQKLQLGGLPSLSKAVGSDLTTWPNIVGQPGPKHFQKVPKKGLGLAWSGWATRSNILFYIFYKNWVMISFFFSLLQINIFSFIHIKMFLYYFDVII